MPANLRLAAQSMREGDAQPLAVEIAAAVEQVHLEQQRAAVEGGPAAEIGHGRPPDGLQRHGAVQPSTA